MMNNKTFMLRSEKQYKLSAKQRRFIRRLSNKINATALQKGWLKKIKTAHEDFIIFGEAEFCLNNEDLNDNT